MTAQFSTALGTGFLHIQQQTLYVSFAFFSRLSLHCGVYCTLLCIPQTGQRESFFTGMCEPDRFSGVLSRSVDSVS